MNKLRNIVITILLLMTSFLSAECVDSAGISGNSCDMIVNTFGLSCDAEMAGTLISDACPVTCCLLYTSDAADE